MSQAQDLQKDSRKIKPDSFCPQPDFSDFKERIWIPLLKSKMASWKLYASCYSRYLENFLHKRSPSSLTADDLYAFARRLKKKGFSSGTYNRVLSVLKHFLKNAFEQGFIDTDFTANVTACFVKAESKNDVCLDSENIKLLFKKLAASDSPIARAIELLILTGASKGEILSARWEDYDPVKHMLAVKSRNGKKRILRLGPQSIAILESLPRPCQSVWIFSGRDKTKHLNDIFLFWDEIRKACGLNHIRIQDLKHNYKNWQKNNNGYSIFLEEQLEPEAKKPSCPPYIDPLIKPEIALIGLASAQYDESGKNDISQLVSSSVENAQLINFLGNILKAGMEALNCHNRNKTAPTLEKLFIDLAKSAFKNAGLSRKDIGGVRSAIYLGLENPEEYLLSNYQQCLENRIYHNLAQSLTLALGFSYRGIEIHSHGSSFQAALQTASLKIAFGDLDIALVGGTGAYNGNLIKEQITEFGKEDSAKMALLSSLAYAEKSKIPVISIIPLSALNDVCDISQKEAAFSEIS